MHNELFESIMPDGFRDPSRESAKNLYKMALSTIINVGDFRELKKDKEFVKVIETFWNKAKGGSTDSTEEAAFDDKACFFLEEEIRSLMGEH